MRILMIGHEFLPRHGGGTEHYTYYLAKELQRRGHELHLYITELADGRPHAELTRGSFDGLDFHQAVNNHKFKTFRHTYKDAAMEANLRVVLDEWPPDIVHVQHLHLHSIGYIDVLKERGLKVVYTLHEYITMCLRNGQLMREGLVLCEGPEPSECAKCAKQWLAPGPLEGKPRVPLAHTGDPFQDAVLLRTAEVKAAFAQVDLFVSPSRFLREKFLAHGMMDPRRILYSDNGMARAAFRKVPRRSGDRLRCGYIGTIAEWKGLHVLVDAFNGLPEAGVECRIYGDLTFMPDYVRALRERRMHLDVRLLGRMDNARIAEILAELDVLIVPSVWFENSPLTIHEAFIAGVPVVCSDRGGMAELVTDGVNGLHFRLGDAADLRAKILRLMREPALLETLRAGMPPIKDIARDAEDMEKRYQALLAGTAVAV